MTHIPDPERAAFHLGVNAEQVTLGAGRVARFVAPGTATQCGFGLFEWRIPARTGSTDTHFRKTFSESFYVTSGTVRRYDGSRWVKAGPGDFLHVPEGGAHGFHNDTDDPAAMLILFAPAPPREAYFRELAEIAAAGRTLTDAEWIELWARHDQYPAPQPAKAGADVLRITDKPDMEFYAVLLQDPEGNEFCVV